MDRASVDFDVVVIGGGHAGAEAALAAARLGVRAACVVLDPSAIGRMSCNPAIGGIAKGQLVREIDALGGEMALCTDETGIQFRMLNTSKGPAVRSPRAQCDRHGYNRAMVRRAHAEPGLQILTGEAVSIFTKETGAGRQVTAVGLADGTTIHCRATIVTTGTFLGGRLFAGSVETAGGRIGEAGPARLADGLRALSLRLSRHKTGTPPRIRRDTIDTTKTTEQPGDPEPRPFSFRTERIDRPQVSCWLTRTTRQTHEIIARNAHLSPMFQGRIVGVGPRYCPSVEDKVVRFAEQDHHLVFLEPEGVDSNDVYPNGISTSLPAEVQEEFLRTIPGLEQAVITRPGYAVEYDFLETDQLRADLHVADIEGLYAAGQVNGTSGYEEAAAQGLIAGINAARFVQRLPPLILDRASSYIGVMIDDLCRVNPREPYRMFTSRAEFRLLLRSDNADRRLLETARRIGLLDRSATERVARKEDRIKACLRHLETVRIEGRTLQALLRRPETTIPDLLILDSGLRALQLSAEELSEVEAEVKYEGYIARQLLDVERMRRMEGRHIPAAFCFRGIPGLSTEAKERLERRRPMTIGEASRLPGVTPADLHLLLAAVCG